MPSPSARAGASSCIGRGCRPRRWTPLSRDRRGGEPVARRARGVRRRRARARRTAGRRQRVLTRARLARGPAAGGRATVSGRHDRARAARRLRRAARSPMNGDGPGRRGRAVRRGLTEPRDQALLLELVSGTVRMRGAIDYQLALRVHAAARRPGRRGADVAAAERVSADLPRSGAGLRRDQRCGRTDAARRQVERRRHGERGASRAVARSRALVWPDAPEPLALAVALFAPAMAGRALARALRQRANASWLAFNNEAPQLCLAANRLHGTRDELQARLLGEGVTTEPTRRAAHGLVVARRPPRSTPRHFARGASWCRTKPRSSSASWRRRAGDRVLDLCASPGGKTVALAARCAPGGQVVACDVRPRRVRLLARTLQRPGRADVPVVHVASAGDLPFAAGRSTSC